MKKELLKEVVGEEGVLEEALNEAGYLEEVHAEEKPKMAGLSLLTAEDIAYRLRISKAMAYHLMQTGEITTVRIRKSVRVREEDLSAFIEKSLYHPSI